ncbi:polysaccharide biosynthesis protein [Catellatospora methionotrophica]|uniref:Polysaccharide biosynthesis protein n=1 Tax=Catellatospora methionotrophica TaxID=121620 RepID=A0A8J3L8X5_9ACTN|nr:polysaccharide biosynthesis C-terminal domain-containing protein [Catellatospora methionotrophica]GIG14420.1 polysaccharide biosynthesis protein [Catellatospora methionotrophica]
MSVTAPAHAGAYGADRGRVMRSSLFNLVGAGVSALAGLALTVVVTRGFDASVAGVLFTLTSVFLILSAAALLGAETGVVYLLAQQRVREETGKIRATVRIATIPVVVASIVLAVGLWFAAPWLVDIMLPDAPAGTVAAIRVFGVFLPTSTITGVHLAVGRGLGTTRPNVMVMRVLRPGLQLLGVVAVLIAGWTSSVALALAWSLPYALGLVVAVLWSAKLRRKAERSGKQPVEAPTREDWGRFWRYASPRAGTGLAQLALQRLDVVLMAALRGPVDAALYTAATRFLVIGQLGGQALGQTVQHRFSGLLAQNQHDEANRLYQMTTTWLIALIWPFYLTWAIFGGQLMTVFGQGYTAGGDAGVVGIVLSLTMLVATACGMVSTVQEMAGHTGVAFFQTMLALVVNVVLNIVLIPSYGIVGAAIAWSTALLIKNLLPLVQLQRRHGLSPLCRGGFVAMAAAVACYAALPLLARALFGDHPLVGVASVLVATVAYLAVVWRCRHVLQLAGLRALRRRGKTPAQTSPPVETLVP